MVGESMFADTLRASWPERERRGWTTLTSFGLQALIAAVLIVLPLLRPSGLPSLRQLSTPISLGNPQPESPLPRGNPHPRFAPAHPELFFRRPSPLPIIQPSVDEGPSQPIGSGPYIPGASPAADPHGIQSVLGEGTQPVVPVPPPTAVARPLQISHISEGNLVHKVQPAYPALARSARIQGVVVLQAVIGKHGNIENLRLISGHPMLAPAAIDAVRQWRYRPYILNNDPIEVETQITVNFSLAGN
jgi:protein TonB